MKTLMTVLLVLSTCAGAPLCAHSEGAPAGADRATGSEADTGRVMIIQQEGETKPPSGKDRALTEEEAYDLVWNLPEVKREIQAILDDGGIPFSTVAVRPEPGSRPEGKNSYYVISLRAIRTKDVMVDLLFSVNAFSGKMSVYDASAGSFISIEDWRRQQK